MCVVQDEFGQKFLQHTIFVANKYTIFDVWSGGTYLGSFIISKYKTRLYGRFGNALYIHSVCAATKGSGFGTMILQACRVMCRTNSEPLSECFIFFQAVKINWWNDRADVSIQAKASVLQLYYLNRIENTIWTDCIPRSINCPHEGEGSPSRKRNASILMNE